MERILVVDDKEYNRRSATHSLPGYLVHIAANMQEGVEELNEGTNFKAVLTDLMMPAGEIPMTKKGLWDENAMGFPLALYAAKLGVPLVGIVTDMNHHDNVYGASFGLFFADEQRKRRHAFQIGESRLMLFDERDYGNLLVRKDGGFDTEKECDEFASELLRGPPHAPDATPLEDRYLGRTLSDGYFMQTRAKNWGEALERLIDGR